MKILSKTHDNGRVVELTQNEFMEFSKLAEALEGKTENETRWDFMNTMDKFTVDINLDGVFGAIQAFYTAKFRVNEIKDMLTRFEKAIEK